MLHFKAVANSKFRKICDIALCIFGTVVMVYTTSLTIVNWVSGDSKPAPPKYCDGRGAQGLGGLGGTGLGY